MMTPSATTIKQTAITWKRLVVLTEESPDRNRLCRYSVYIANEAGMPVSLATQHATATAADHEHQRLANALATGTMPKETLSR